MAGCLTLAGIPALDCEDKDLLRGGLTATREFYYFDYLSKPTTASTATDISALPAYVTVGKLFKGNTVDMDDAMLITQNLAVDGLVPLYTQNFNARIPLVTSEIQSKVERMAKGRFTIIVQMKNGTFRMIGYDYGAKVSAMEDFNSTENQAPAVTLTETEGLGFSRFFKVTDEAATLAYLEALL